MVQTKEQIRKTLLEKRGSMDVAAALEKSRSILRSLVNLPEYMRAVFIHTYVSSKTNEADTRELIAGCFRERKRVAVPVIDTGSKTMRHSEIQSLNDLQPGSFRILEPTTIREINLGDIDLVIIPVVAVDFRGNRIGFGGGYYDRFLKQVGCPKVALAYDFQMLDSLPTSENDDKVDIIVTESGVHRCRQKG